MQPSDYPEVALFPEHRFALSQPRGIVTGDLVVTYGRAMNYHRAWEPGFTEVWDVTLSEAVDVVPSDLGALRALEMETKDLLKGSRTIIIADRPLLRMPIEFYARMMKPFGRKIVASKSQAHAASMLGITTLPILTSPPGE